MRTTLNYKAAKSIWLLLGLAWLAMYLPSNNWDISKALVNPGLFLFATIGTLFCYVLPALGEPLFFQIDSQAQTLSYGRARLPWKKVLNIQRVHSEISKQVGHSSVKHFFLLFLDNKQLLYIEISERWPLHTLKILQEHIASHNGHKKAR